ncbi:MAG: ROK family transcriptional regulator [bacterium]|nr:ROK family transcriptional regulator [bacterium]
MPQSQGLRPAGKTKHEATRRSNRRLLLQSVFDTGPISRADLARSTGLGRATVSDIAADLIAEGLVVESGRGESTGGKPPTLIELDPEGRFTVAVDLSRRPFEAALLNLRGRIVARVAGRALHSKSRDAFEELHQVVADLMGTATAPPLGIGIGVPGTVDRTGIIVASEQLAWQDAPLREEMEDVYGLPTYIAGDAEAAAVAELGRTGSDPAGRMLYVKVDDRIAVGTIAADRLNRTPVHGGDLTHMKVPGWNDECDCGRVGCLGSRVSMIRVLGPDYVDMGTEARQRLAVETTPRVDDAAEYLGAALAPVVAAIDADLVVVGGQMGEWPSVPERLGAGIDDRLGWCPDVVRARLGASGVVLGAAAMVLSGELGVVWT